MTRCILSLLHVSSFVSVKVPHLCVLVSLVFTLTCCLIAVLLRVVQLKSLLITELCCLLHDLFASQEPQYCDALLTEVLWQ